MKTCQVSNNRGGVMNDFDKTPQIPIQKDGVIYVS
jgi:hypothetical protein